VEHKLTEDMAVIVMHPKDTVATALRDLSLGEEVLPGLRAAQPIRFGHKLALGPIAAGDLVYKYGEVIGRATRAIAAGEHVHVHNIEGTRGRGDLAAAKEQGTDDEL